MSVAMAPTFPRAEAHAFDVRDVDLAEAETNPVFADCLRVWRDGCGGDLPCKSCVDALAFDTATLPWIMLVEVEGDGAHRRFRYRLTGTGIDTIQNRNLTRTYVEEQRPQALRDVLVTAMTKLVEDRRPQFVEMKFTNATGNKRWLRSLRLPLAAPKDHDRVRYLFIAVQLF
jgi:hypothetical protein